MPQEILTQLEQLEEVVNIQDESSRLRVLYNLIGNWVRKPAHTIDSLHQTVDNLKDVSENGRLFLGTTTESAGNLTSFIAHLNGSLGQTRLMFQYSFLGVSGCAGVAAAADGCFSVLQGKYISGATYFAGSFCHFGSCVLGLPATYKGYFIPSNSMLLTTVGSVFQWSVPYCRRGLRHAGSNLTKSADLMNGGVSASATVRGIKTFVDPLAKITNPLEAEEQ